MSPLQSYGEASCEAKNKPSAELWRSFMRSKKLASVEL